MEPIPIFQIVRIDDTRVVIRHYNEAADKFEKVCSARDDVHAHAAVPSEYLTLPPDPQGVLPRDYHLLQDKLLITPDGRICYSYKGRLYYPGKVSDFVTLLSTTTDKLQMLDISVLRLPFQYLFVLQRDESFDSFDEVVSYKEIDEGLELETLSDGCVKYLPYEVEGFDAYGGISDYTVLYRRRG